MTSQFLRGHPEPRRAIVLGGSGTVGRAVVAELSGAGARVGFTYRNGHAVAEPLAKQCAGTISAKVDLTDEAALATALPRMARELGGVDALVHCAVQTSAAAEPTFDRIEDVTSAGWDALMGVNVKSAFFAVKHLLPHLAEGANIVFFASIDGIKPLPSPPPYAASRGALHGLVLSLSKALGKQRIAVNMIAPGILKEGASRMLPAELRADYLKHCGLRRFGEVHEVASLAGFLALENTYVTGQVFSVDGGL